MKQIRTAVIGQGRSGRDIHIDTSLRIGGWGRLLQ